jgi:hypothetical protein
MSMRERARVKIDEILRTDPRHILPIDVERRIKTITEKAVAAQTN